VSTNKQAPIPHYCPWFFNPASLNYSGILVDAQHGNCPEPLCSEHKQLFKRTHMFNIPLTLAIDTTAIIIFVVLTIFSIIGSLSKSAQKKKASSSGQAPTAGSSPPDTNLEDMAAKRRQQLQELARKRGAQAGQAAPQAPQAQQTPFQSLVQQTQPQQVPPQQTRRSSSSTPPTQAPPAAPSPYATQRQGEAARRQALEAQRRNQQAELARRQQADQALRQQADQARQQAAKQARQTPSQLLPSKFADHLGQGITNISTSHDWDTDTGGSITHRHVPDADATYTITGKRSRKPKMTLRIDKMSIKQAFIFKELIDVPIALRQDNDSFL
jgi:hypothetical protein